MTEQMTEQKRTVAIHVPVLTRVEGEGALYLRIDNGEMVIPPFLAAVRSRVG